MSSIFCLKLLFSKKKNASWDFLPLEAQQHIIEFLTPKEKAKLSITCKKNYDLVKSVPTKIHWLQFCPIRYNSQFIEVLVFLDEGNLNHYSFYFGREGLSSYLRTTKKQDGLDAVVSSRELKSEYREMGDLCFQGWVSGAKVHTLDIRGDYTGKLPNFLEGLQNFSFTDKYTRTASAIPAWLDVIEEGPVNFMLMSNHWEQILGHRHFANPVTTCKLTGFDGIGHEYLSSLNCKQIQLNGIRDEKSFNVLIKKWVAGGFAPTFEWLVVTSTIRPLITEMLLEEVKVQSLEASIFEEAEKEIKTNDRAEYFLIYGAEGKYGVFRGIDNYARFEVINQQLVDEVPELSIYFPRVWRPAET